MGFNDEDRIAINSNQNMLEDKITILYWIAVSQAVLLLGITIMLIGIMLLN